MHCLAIFDRRLFRAAVTAALVAYGYLSHGQAPNVPILEQRLLEDALLKARTPDEQIKAVDALQKLYFRQDRELLGELEREAKSDTDSDFEKLLGTWVGVAVEYDGQAPRALKAPQEVARLVFKRERLKSHPGQWTSLFEYECHLRLKNETNGQELPPLNASGRISSDDAKLPFIENLSDRATFKMWDVDLKRTPMEFWLSNDTAAGTEIWRRANTFELDGDRMVWNAVFPFPNMPKEGEKLKTFPGSGRTLVHFEREKKGLARTPTAATVKSPAKPQRQMPAKKPRSQSPRSRPSTPE